MRKEPKLNPGLVSQVSHRAGSLLCIAKEGISLVLSGLGENLNDKQKRSLSIAKDGVERLIGLVSDIVDFSRLGSVSIDLKKEEVSVTEILNTVLNFLERGIITKSITLVRKFPDRAALASVDRDRISRVFMNLIENIIKRTPEKGTITAEIHQHDCIEIALRSSGSDINAHLISDMLKMPIDSLKELILRKDTSISMEFVFAKAMVELHNGNIRIEQDDSTGYTIFVSLPGCSNDSEVVKG